jgi:hypothetical protein
MRVRLIGTMTGTRDGKDWPPIGGEIDLPADEAIALVGNRMAVPVDTSDVELAVVADPSVEVRVAGSQTTVVPPPTGMTTKSVPTVGKRGR